MHAKVEKAADRIEKRIEAPKRSGPNDDSCNCESRTTNFFTYAQLIKNSARNIPVHTNTGIAAHIKILDRDTDHLRKIRCASASISRARSSDSCSTQ